MLAGRTMCPPFLIIAFLSSFVTTAKSAGFRLMLNKEERRRGKLCDQAKNDLGAGDPLRLMRLFVCIV